MTIVLAVFDFRSSFELYGGFHRVPDNVGGPTVQQQCVRGPTKKVNTVINIIQ